PDSGCREGSLRRRGRRRADVPRTAGRRDLPARLARDARPRARRPRRARCARRLAADERRGAGARPPPRHAGRLPARDATVPRPQRRPHGRRAAARPAARGRGHRTPRRIRAHRPLLDVDPVHPDGCRVRGRVRRRAVLRPHGGGGVRGRRPDARGCGAHARRAAVARLPTHRAAARLRRPRRGARALVRTRARRVRCDDHVRGLARAGHADAAARHLRRVRPLVRRRARDRCAARRLLLRAPPRGEMAALRLDIRVPLRSFDLAVALEGGVETLAVAGPSGAGKSTLLRAIAGLVPATGVVEVNGRDWSALPPERRSVGFVFQDYALFPHLTVRGNVAFGGPVGDLLERLGIAHLADARPGELSGGERQRVALARALARTPEVLLLDEPLAALDAHTRDTVRAELRATLRTLELPALVVTHDFVDAAALADRVGVLVDGALVQVGRPEELIASPTS